MPRALAMTKGKGSKAAARPGVFFSNVPGELPSALLSQPRDAEPVQGTGAVPMEVVGGSGLPKLDTDDQMVGASTFDQDFAAARRLPRLQDPASDAMEVDDQPPGGSATAQDANTDLDWDGDWGETWNFHNYEFEGLATPEEMPLVCICDSLYSASFGSAVEC